MSALRGSKRAREEPPLAPDAKTGLAGSGESAIFRRRTALSSCYRSPAPDDRYPRRVVFRPVV